MRHYPSFKILGSLFCISSTSAWRYVHFLLPHLYEALSSFNTIIWPTNWDTIPIGFCGCQFIIDCTSHQRDRVHPGQQLYYRGDKGFHFLTVEIGISPKGKLLKVMIANGHNSDKAMFNLETRIEIENDNICGLADRGYQHCLLIRPDDKDMANHLGLSVDEFGAQHSKYRSPGEMISSLTKLFSFASQRVTQPPEFQAFALMSVYLLTDLNLYYCPSWYLPRVR